MAYLLLPLWRGGCEVRWIWLCTIVPNLCESNADWVLYVCDTLITQCIESIVLQFKMIFFLGSYKCKQENFVSLNRIKAHLEENNKERVEAFMNDSPAAVKKLLGDFDNFDVTMHATNVFSDLQNLMQLAEHLSSRHTCTAHSPTEYSCSFSLWHC